MKWHNKFMSMITCSFSLNYRRSVRRNFTKSHLVIQHVCQDHHLSRTQVCTQVSYDGISIFITGNYFLIIRLQFRFSSFVLIADVINVQYQKPLNKNYQCQGISYTSWKSILYTSPGTIVRWCWLHTNCFTGQILLLPIVRVLFNWYPQTDVKTLQSHLDFTAYGSALTYDSTSRHNIKS